MISSVVPRFSIVLTPFTAFVLILLKIQSTYKIVVER
jgi:hypothetical protein